MADRAFTGGGGPQPHDEPSGGWSGSMVTTEAPDAQPPSGALAQVAARKPLQALSEHWKKLPLQVLAPGAAALLAVLGIGVFALSSNEHPLGGRTQHHAMHPPPKVAGGKGESSQGSPYTQPTDQGASPTTAPGSDLAGPTSPSTQNGSPSTPIPAVQTPETPFAILLPIAASGMLATLLVRRKRTGAAWTGARAGAAPVERRDPAGHWTFRYEPRWPKRGAASASCQELSRDLPDAGRRLRQGPGTPEALREVHDIHGRVTLELPWHRKPARCHAARHHHDGHLLLERPADDSTNHLP